MKIVHLSDLHLGKKVNGFSMIGDQKYILDEILKIVGVQNPDAVVIAGDIYDRSVPSAEAVALFDDFAVALSGLVPHIFIISGNHDSAERLAFGGRLMQKSGVHLSPVYDGKAEPVVINDEYGPVCFYMLPFLRPANVRAVFGDCEAGSYSEALDFAVRKLGIDPSARNVLITHQFVTGASTCDSEELSVGGADNVDASVFEGFDYVALGHIHGPQNAAGERIRYCGTPLKYSFSEINHKKSVTTVTLGEKKEGHAEDGRKKLCDITVETAALKPLRDMAVIRGKYDEITLKSFYGSGSFRDDYLRIILTDEDDVPQALGNLRVIYPNMMSLEYDNLRTRSSAQVETGGSEKTPPSKLFEMLFEAQNGRSMDESQRKIIEDLVRKIWEEEE